jgi:hypothetical protein
MSHGFGIGRAISSDITGSDPKIDRLRNHPGMLEVPGEDFGLRPSSLREALLQGMCDALM